MPPERPSLKYCGVLQAGLELIHGAKDPMTQELKDEAKGRRAKIFTCGKMASAAERLKYCLVLKDSPALEHSPQNPESHKPEG